MKKTKVKTNSKGITLIALVVTIVVLLTLAGVSINLVLGNNGIIAKAQDAEVGTRAGRLEDEIELWKADAYIADNANGTTETEEEMLARLVRDKLITQDDEVDETNKIIKVKKKDKQTIVKEISYAYKTSTITENIFEYTPEGVITGIKEKYLTYENPNLANETIKMASINNEPIKLASRYSIYLVKELNEEITIPKEINGTKIVGIGDYAFQIDNLRQVTINAEITSIGKSVFSYSALTNITIPNSVTSIGDSAFQWCPLLKEIRIPNSVTNIGAGAFADTGLTNITIPNSVTSIGEEAFSGTDLINITIPNSVINMGFDVFDYCYSLQTINVPFKEGEIPAGWSYRWKGNCSAQINYMQ